MNTIKLFAKKKKKKKMNASLENIVTMKTKIRNIQTKHYWS